MHRAAPTSEVWKPAGAFPNSFPKLLSRVVLRPIVHQKSVSPLSSPSSLSAPFLSSFFKNIFQRMSRGEQTTDLRHMSYAELAHKQNSLVHSEKNIFDSVPHTTVKLGIIAFRNGCAHGQLFFIHTGNVFFTFLRT